MTTENKDQLETALKLLGLEYIREHWDEVLQKAKTEKPSYYRLLADCVLQEAAHRREKMRRARIKRAKIPEPWIMDTFPFDRQPKLKKRFVLELYDSLEFMKKPQDLIFIGPTGCGKSGLATSYLIHALNHGYRGYWIDFKELIELLWRSVGDNTEKKVIKRFSDFDILAVDELGYTPIRKDKAGLFFDLMRRRHKKKTTLITTQLGYEEWGEFLQDKHLTVAMLDRMTENCTVFNMRDCISLRPKNVRHATKNN